MALPKEPRQKMINIMYLVLTALLALNVSAEILNAFTTVDNSLRGTNNTVNASTETILASLQEKMSDPTSRAKAEIWYPKAQRAQALSKEMYTYIDGLRTSIHKEAGFDPAKNGDSSFKADNLDIATRIMVEEGKGKELQQRLAKYKADLLAIDPAFAAEFKDNLQIDLSMPKTQDKSKKDWESAYFHMVPTVAAMTILSKFQNDVKTSENRVVAFAHEQVGKVTVRYDQFAAIVGQSTNYVMPGGEVEIMAGVGAFSKAALPQITINGQGAALGADGQAKLKVPAGGLGKHTVPVVIRFKDQEGNPQTVTKNIEYTVGQANASIALDKMNVLYMGIANPVTVAASGGGDDRIGVSISNGRMEKTGAGKYNAFVTGGDNCTITVTVDGKVAGASQFRIRRIPTPTGTVGGYASGDNVNAGAFKSQAGVGAYIKDFPFELQYTVTGYTISTDSDDGDIVEATVQGNAWGGSARNVLNQVKPGKTVYIDGIRATGPDGRNMKLPSLVYYIK
jgi:gliding motility-associated protein GldM